MKTTEYYVFNDPYFESKLVNKVPTSKKRFNIFY